MSRIEIPGQPPIDMSGPSADAQYIVQQVGQVVQVLNVIAGQIDTALRLASGAYSKHELKVRFENFDRQARVAQAVAQGDAQKRNINEGEKLTIDDAIKQAADEG